MPFDAEVSVYFTKAKIKIFTCKYIAFTRTYIYIFISLLRYRCDCRDILFASGVDFIAASLCYIGVPPLYTNIYFFKTRAIGAYC